MNTITLTTLSLVGSLLAFSACEGEPPKVPQNSPSTPLAEPNVALPASPASTAPNGSRSAPPLTAAPPSPGASGGSSGAPQPAAATEQPSAISAVSAPTSAAPALADGATASPSAHAIVGTITSVPARAAGAGVVYLEDAGIVPNRGASAVVDNHGMSFTPFITVVHEGGRVVFSNTDPFPHNVFSPDNEKFNLGMVQMKGSSSHIFKSAGVYSLLCNLHPNMLGYVVVSPSSYFAKANAKGQFTIKDVPPGSYKITAWAPRLQPITRPITLNDSDATADFALHR
jgi:plastocyanin